MPLRSSDSASKASRSYCSTWRCLTVGASRLSSGCSRRHPDVPIIILSTPGNEGIARQAVQRGARDYVVKGQVDGCRWRRALRYLSKRKLTRNAPRVSEARFPAISETSRLGIFASDAQGRYTYTNAAYQEISGLSFEQTLGTRWSQAIHSDDRHRVLAEWREAMRGMHRFQTEFRFVQRNRGVVWARVNSTAMGRAGAGWACQDGGRHHRARREN